MMETLTELLNIGLAAALLAAWRGLPLLAVVLLIDLIGRHRIAPRFRRCLWMLVVVRMLLPISLESPVSLSGPMDALALAAWNTVQPAPPQSAVQTEIFTLADGTEVMRPRLPPHMVADGIVFLPPLDDHLTPSNRPSWSFSAWSEDAIPWLPWIWAVGTAFLIARAAIANMRFSRSIGSAGAIADEQLQREVASVCQQMRIARCPRVVHLNSLHAPAVFGWWKPVLCFPAQSAVEVSPQELSWVLRHELAHVKSRDALVLMIASLMKAVQWFNPLAWIADARLKQVIEQAADAAVTRDMNPTTVTEYGRVLLRYATADCNAAHPRLVGLLPMASSSGLEGRIDALGRKHARSWAAKFAMLVLLLIVAGTGLSDAAPVPSEYRPSENSAVPTPTYRQATPPQRRRVSIDVRRTLAKAEQLQPGIDAEPFIKSYFTAYSDPPPAPPEIVDGMLIADLSDFELRTIQQRLRAFERSGPWQISLECRMIEADLKLAEAFAWNAPDVKLVVQDSNMAFEKALVGQLDRWDELLLDESASNVLTATRNSEPTRPVLAAKLSDSQMRMFVRASQNHPRCRTLQAPRVTCFNGQLISLASIVERPFVTNVSIAADNPQGPLAPTLEVIQEGWSARVNVEATEEGAVDLACIFRETKITDVEMANLPIRSPTSPESDVVVQVPNVQRVSAGSQVTLQVGESLAIAVPRTFRDRSEPTRPPAMFYVFTPRLLSDADMMSSYVKK